ncbi:MAG: ATP phosphoribosyltransferase regulatory subunit [Methylococcaceae bacterium]|nr:ATP phosphoribosyltransferase regulatory subunit [Methylococcaceae bacterium]
MQKKDSWLLPDGIDEVLPEQAEYLETLRRQILDTFASWGYQLVIPPFVDYLDSLLTGSGHDLNLQTFKLTDPLSGQILGVRADMTPQVARIDVHNLKHDWPTRLCYAGTTLNAVGDGLEKTRSPMQIGAELYGHQGIESDYEVIRLMLEMLAISGIENVHLDLGHVGIFGSLSQAAGLSSEQEAELFDVLQRKAVAELHELVESFAIDASHKQALAALAKLNGDRTILNQAQQLFGDQLTDLNTALADLSQLADKLQRDFPQLAVSFDLGELRGYHYHTGIVFAAFIPSVGREIARGGRYDNIGQIFGRARAATGFSADLRILVNLYRASVSQSRKTIIFAPSVDDSDLYQQIRDLRAQGITVIEHLPNQSGQAQDLGCTAILEKQDTHWVVKPYV